MYYSPCRRPRPTSSVVGAGVVGAAVALARPGAGCSVVVLDRGPVAGGTTGAGEGNILVSDKEPGPGARPRAAVPAALAEVGEHVERTGRGFEFEPKGGLVVATDGAALPRLARARRAASGRAGVERRPGAGGRAARPRAASRAGTSPAACSTRRTPRCSRCWPPPACSQARAGSGARVRTGVTVTGMLRAGDRVIGVRTDRATSRPAPWSTPPAPGAARSPRWPASTCRSCPRRGFVLVTEPLPPLIRHKVYAADYVADVASDDAGLETTAVVEGTRAGTVLIGASRERVGFDRTMSLPVVRRLAAQAVRLFPVLADVSLMRSLRRLPAVLPRPPAGDRRRSAGARAAARVRARGRGHRARHRHRAPARPGARRRRARPRPGALPPRALRGGRRMRTSGRHLRLRRPPVPFTPGQTRRRRAVGGGVRSWRTTRFGGRPRGLFCGIGVCFDCLVEVDGRPDQRACLDPGPAEVSSSGPRREPAVPTTACDVAVVGAGPAGAAAAVTAAGPGPRRARRRRGPARRPVLAARPGPARRARASTAHQWRDLASAARRRRSPPAG